MEFKPQKCTIMHRLLLQPYDIKKTFLEIVLSKAKKDLEHKVKDCDIGYIFEVISINKILNNSIENNTGYIYLNVELNIESIKLEKGMILHDCSVCEVNIYGAFCTFYKMQIIIPAPTPPTLLSSNSLIDCRVKDFRVFNSLYNITAEKL